MMPRLSYGLVGKLKGYMMVKSKKKVAAQGMFSRRYTALGSENLS